MFKKGLITLVCLTVMSALWSWAATTYSISTKINSLGSTATVVDGKTVYTPIVGGSIKVRDFAAQNTGIKYTNFTTSAAVDVVVTPAAGYKISALTKNGVAQGVAANQTAPLTVSFVKPSPISTQFLVATFAVAGDTAVVSKTWQLQLMNNNGGGKINYTRAGVSTDYTSIGKLMAKNYIDTTPVVVTVTPNAGYNIDYLVVNGVKTFYGTDVAQVVNVDPNTGRIKSIVAGYKKKAIVITTANITNGGGIAPLNPVADPYGKVRLIITPQGTNNVVKSVTTTGGVLTLTDRFGDPVTLPYVGAVKATISGITSAITVSATYGMDVANSGQYSGCTQTCHKLSTTPQSVRDADTQWLASSHRTSNVDCVSCHQVMPGPDYSTTAKKEALCASCHIAGATPTAVHTAAQNACSTCHTFSGGHNPVKAAVAGTVAAQHPAGRDCAICHVNGAAPAETVTITSPGTPDVVDAGDSFLAAPVEFAGSNACRACHATHFEGWSKSLHNKPTKYFANQGEEILTNDQDGDGLNDFAEGMNFNDPAFATTYGYANPFANQIPNAPILKKVGADFVIQIGATEYKINRTQGGNGYWKQRFYTEVGGGNYVLPVQWNEVLKRYSAYNSVYWYTTATSSTTRFNQAYGSPELLAAFKTAYAAGGDGPASSSWENRCAGCHQSGLTVKLQDGEVVSGYADLNVGCEACHGPSAAHAANPTKANVVNPNDYLSQTGGAYKAVETCGKCHQRGESKQYLGAGTTAKPAGTAGSIQKKVEAPAKLSADLTTAIFFPMGGDLFGGGWYTDNVGVFGTKSTMTYNGYAGFPAYVASNSHHQQWEDMEQGKHGATYAETTPGAQKMACWSCHDLHSPKGSHATRSRLTVGGTTVTGLSATNNTLCLACHAGKGKFAALTLGSLQADPTGADVVAAVNAHVSARIPGKSITAANYLVGGRKGGGSSKYGIIEYLNGQCVACHMPLAPSSTAVRIFTDALGKGQGDQHSHTMKTILKPAGASITSCSGCHGDFTDFVAEKVGAKTVESGQVATGVAAVSGFVGTKACQSCHLGQYGEYTETLHNKPLKTIAVLGETVVLNDSNANGVNDFKDGLDFNTVSDLSIFQTGSNPWSVAAGAGNAPKLSVEGTKYFITIGAVKYEIARTQGGNGKWKQRYHTKIGEGYYVLPVQFNEISKKYEAYNNTNWYKPNNTPWISAGASNTDVATIAQVATLLTSAGLKAEYPGITLSGNIGPSTSSWDNRCSACHQTGVNIEYKEYNGTMQVVSSSADLNIGCESCHGGGAAHLKNPYAANSIINPANFTNKYRANEVCGQCHSRTEGFAHFSSAAGTVFAGVEAPSLKGDADNKKAKSYVLGDNLLDYIYKVLPNAWKPNGSTGNSGLTAVAYDGATGKFVNGVAANGHHQQWHDLDSGPHGAAKGITCFSCHDPHKKTSGNIRTSKKMGEVTVATKTSDNSLCLSCHAGSGVFSAVTAADVAGIAAAPNSDVVMEAVYAHLVAKAGYSTDEAKKASWKSKYLQSVQANGNSATFGIAVYRVGECVSCHMPFSAKSGVHTSTNANGRPQGDQRSHTMKTLWSGLNDLTAQKGLTSATAPTSCSACHPVTLTP